MAKGQREYTRKQRIKATTAIANAFKLLIQTDPTPHHTQQAFHTAISETLDLDPEDHRITNLYNTLKTHTTTEHTKNQPHSPQEIVTTWELTTFPSAIPTKKTQPKNHGSEQSPLPTNTQTTEPPQY